MTIEEFATNLMHVFSDQNKSPVAYVTFGVLINCIQAALVPRDSAGLQEFPKMLYRRDRTEATGEDETLIIGNAEEQQLAEAQGWRTTPTPKPPGYPQYWVEISVGRGTQYRQVMIRNSTEERMFRSNVDLSQWTEDNYPNPCLGGTPVPLSDLVEEHTRRLHRQLDEELRNPIAAEDENAAPEEN